MRFKCSIKILPYSINSHKYIQPSIFSNPPSLIGFSVSCVPHLQFRFTTSEVKVISCYLINDYLSLGYNFILLFSWNNRRRKHRRRQRRWLLCALPTQTEKASIIESIKSNTNNQIPPSIRSQKTAAATFLHPFTVGDPIKENHSKSSVYLMSVFQVIPKPIHGHSRKEFLHPQILLIQILWIQLCLFILDLYKHNFFEKNENWESRRRVGKGISFG